MSSYRYEDWDIIFITIIKQTRYIKSTGYLYPKLQIKYTYKLSVCLSIIVN